ncbi:hypothetical protein DFH29DRAFT_105815 [Suillus ampliporus]|nr:hypothetical protein DFH29DRAFT_105815 [Suillus ampliporus]
MEHKPTTAGNSLATDLDDLASYLERSLHVVQGYTDVIEHKYARPALDKMSKYFQAQPLTMTWVTTTRTLFTVMRSLVLLVLSVIGSSIFKVCASLFIALASPFLALASGVVLFVGPHIFIVFWGCCSSRSYLRCT